MDVRFTLALGTPQRLDAARQGSSPKEDPMKKLGAFFGVMSVVAAGSALAAPQLQSGSYAVSGDGLDACDCSTVIWWEQPPDGASGLSSQDDTCYPFQSECADDFMGDGDWATE
jgi:hypothetical protein